MNEIQGTVTIDLQVYDQIKSQAAAYRALDPESAKKGAEVIKTAVDIFTIESEHNGEGVISISRNGLYDLIHMVTGVKPIEIKVLQDNVKAGPYKPEVRI